MSSASLPGQMPPDWNEDRRPDLFGAVIFFMAMTTLTVLIRLGCQFSAHRKLFLDDLFIVLAMIFDNALLSVDMFGLSNSADTRSYATKPFCRDDKRSWTTC